MDKKNKPRRHKLYQLPAEIIAPKSFEFVGYSKETFPKKLIKRAK